MRVGLVSMLLVFAVVCPVFAQPTAVFDTVFYSDAYGSRTATLYIPSVPNGVGVVLGHWWTGERSTMRCWAESLAADGYTAMAFDYYDFNYRASICKYPKPVTTFKLAVEFLRRGGAAFGVTTGKIVGLGQSEGSIHWAQSIVWDNDDAFFGTDPAIDDHLDAAVLIYGAYDTENFLQAASFHMDTVWDPFFSAVPELRATKGNAIANVENITTPILLFHATDDAVIRYEHSVAFHESLQAHGKLSELYTGAWGGHTYDVPLQGVKEFTAQGLVTKDIVLRFLEQYVLLPPNMAAGETINVQPTSVSPQGDTLYITGEIRNPEDHSVTVRAFIAGVESSFMDSLELFDDGQHGDGVPADNIVGGILGVSGLEEDVYRVGLMTYDGLLDQSHVLRKTAAFTTMGPLVIDTASRDALPDTVYWGEEPLFWLNLKNLGSVRATRNVAMRLESLDSCVIVPPSVAPFGDVLAGGTGLDTPFKFWFDRTCVESREIIVVAHILSDGYEYWRDTLSFVVVPNPNGVDEPGGVPHSFALSQNYPNPFNPLTTIEYALPRAGYVVLKVYNMLGEEVETLVEGKHAAGTFKATWDASNLPSGVYFYRLHTGEFVETKKAVFVR